MSLTILLIRHGEKPAAEAGDPDFGKGLTESGEEDKHSLAVRGWQRAGAWAVLFGSGAGNVDYPAPGAVYAANPDLPATDGASRTRRPWQTVAPLCRRLAITPVTTYAVGEEDRLVADVLGRAGVVLISWEHKKIGRAIAPAIVAGGPAPPRLVPDWDRTRYDVVWRFDRAEVGAAWSFRQSCPRLLGGDLSAPMA